MDTVARLPFNHGLLNILLYIGIEKVCLVHSFLGPRINVFFFCIILTLKVKMFSHSCKKCYIYEERQWRRIERTAARSREMRMKV